MRENPTLFKDFKDCLSYFLALGLLWCLLLFTSCKNERVSDESIKVVVSTSLIEAVVKAIGNDRVEVITIVPAGMCPGHFDLKPGDIATLSNARLFLNHGWERWTEELVKSVDNENLIMKTVQIEGNWMVPQTQKKAADEIARILSLVDPPGKERYMDNLYHYKEIVDSVALEMRRLSEDLKGTKVLCSEYQVEFLKWLGFRVIATYGRPEELTPKHLIELVRTARSGGIEMVVDNLQSGQTAGKQIAEEADAKWAVLTNFPLRGSYTDALKENVNRLIQAIHNE